MGFHAPAEAARILAESIDYAAPGAAVLLARRLPPGQAQGDDRANGRRRVIMQPETRCPSVSEETMPRIAAATLIAGRPVSDVQFDQVYASELRFVSHQHWTPVAVATRAARLLSGAGASDIVDVGSGVGKFCIVGALTTPARFTGIEQRGKLVLAARTAAQRFGAERVRFVRANVLELKLDEFDGFYLYNPFFEQVLTPVLPIDHGIEHCPALYREYVYSTARKLARARAGTAVVTYHGFGGLMPSGYRCVHDEVARGGRLELWVKAPSGSRDGRAAG